MAGWFSESYPLYLRRDLKKQPRTRVVRFDESAGSDAAGLPAVPEAEASASGEAR